nr:HNH endonuclease [Mongoliimonas terrestris]
MNVPTRPPRICSCGKRVPSDVRCRCEIERDKDRRARAEASRPSARERGYTSKWETARAGFLAKHPKCFRCNDPATVVHHSVPHRGDKALFWDRSLWRPACRACHDGPLQSIEKGGRG